VFFKRFEVFLTAALSLKFVNLTTIGLGLVGPFLRLPSHMYGFCIFNFQCIFKKIHNFIYIVFIYESSGKSVINICTWDISKGLVRKLSDSGFLNIVKEYDVMCFNECWVKCPDDFDIEGL
jgi:hypothetical protein